MKKYITLINQNKLLSGSLILLIGTNFINFLNYLYHFVLGRMLGPVGYGELAALISIINLVGMIMSSVGLVVTKFVSSKEDDYSVIYNWFKKYFITIGIFFTFITILFSPFIAEFLKLDSYLEVILVGATFIFAFPSVLNKSYFQGRLEFGKMVTSLFSENSAKLIFGFLFVYLGYSVLGATFGLTLAAVIGLFVSYLLLSLKKSKKTVSFNKGGEVLKYFIPVFIQSLTTTSLYTVDLVLVKHFFAPDVAGIYAAVSSLGKIIFFATVPISSVMFPIAAKNYSENKNNFKTLLLSALVVFLPCVVILLIYAFLPVFAVNLLYGSLFLKASDSLLLFGIFMTLFSLAYLLINYYLSINKTYVSIYTSVAAVIQIIGIYLFHQQINQVILVSIYTIGILLILLILGLIKDTRPSKR